MNATTNNILLLLDAVLTAAEHPDCAEIAADLENIRAIIDNRIEKNAELFPNIGHYLEAQKAAVHWLSQNPQTFGADQEGAKAQSFRINEVVMDTKAKEFLKISNGIENNGQFTPTEAVALRIVGFKNGKPLIAYTYRKVEPTNLAPIAHPNPVFEEFATATNSNAFTNIGRI